jgi:hypothetical protein
MATRFAQTFLGVIAGVFGAVGVVASSSGAVVGWGFLAAMIGVGTSMAATSPPARYANLVRVTPARAGIIAGAGSFTACVAIVGMVTLLGAASVPLLIGFAASGAWLCRRLRLSTRATVDRVTPSVEKDVPPATQVYVIHLGDLPVEALCVAWRRSYVQLQRTSDVSTWNKIVDVRRCLLDEFERRDRQGFARWLASGARAAGDPSRYLAAGG